MEKYGHGIISNLFKRRPKRRTVCTGLASRSEADSDRSDIGVFEVGLSSQQHGDYKQGTGIAAQEAESVRLIAIAKDFGLYIEKSQWEDYGDRKRLPSGESIVYLSEDGKVVIKVRNPFAKSVVKRMHAQDAIYEHLLHNILFPNTRYTFRGISESSDGVRIVLTQKYIPDIYAIPTQGMIDQYLIDGLGFVKEDRFYYGNDFVAVTDVFADGDNVLVNGDKLYFIDPIIKFKRPAAEVLEQYYRTLK